MSNNWLSFDLSRGTEQQPQKLISARQGDGALRFTTVSLSSGGDPYDITGKLIVFEALKPDNTRIIDSANCNILDSEAGVFRYTFNKEIFTASGKFPQAFFKIFDKNGNAESTFEVSIEVTPNLVEMGINSKDFISDYDDMLNLVKQKYNQFGQEVQDAQDNVVSIKGTLAAIQNSMMNGLVPNIHGAGLNAAVDSLIWMNDLDSEVRTNFYVSSTGLANPSIDFNKLALIETDTTFLTINKVADVDMNDGAKVGTATVSGSEVG